jgi:hypothetical protein
LSESLRDEARRGRAAQDPKGGAVRQTVLHARDYRPVMAKGGQRGRIARMGHLSWSLVEIAGGWAETSERLSAEERAELARMNQKARNPRTPL